MRLLPIPDVMEKNIYALTPELFVSYIMLFVLMIPPAKELTTAVSQMKKGRACADRIAEFLEEKEQVATTQQKGAASQQFLTSAIVFDHVSFCYKEGVLVFDGKQIPIGKIVEGYVSNSNNNPYLPVAYHILLGMDDKNIVHIPVGQDFEWAQEALKQLQAAIAPQE